MKLDSIFVRMRKTKKMHGGSLCKRNYNFPKNGRSWFHFKPKPIWYKLQKLNKQISFSTVGFGCWPWTASKTTDKGYFGKMLHHDQGHAQGHDQGHEHDEGHDQGHDQGRVRAWDRDPRP